MIKLPSPKLLPLYLTSVYVGLLILYGTVGFRSLGYDDEFFNITVVEKYGFDVVAYIQGIDVHPPGSYFINWILFSIFGEWNLVRLVVSIFSASLLIYAIDSVRRRYGLSVGLAAFFLLGLNPAILLWCTGIRWYAFFIPVLLWLCITPKKNNWWYWAKLFIGLLLLGYIGYAAFILAPTLLVLYWRNCQSNTREKLRAIAIYGGIAALIYSYQLMIFVGVHFPNKESQVSSLLRSLMGFAIAQISNQGVFPLSLAGISSAIGTFGLLVLGLWHSIKQFRATEYLLPYWLGVVGLITSGLAGKFRNFVILSPLQALWFATLDIYAGKKKVFTFFLMFIVIGNCIGVFNVANHQNTTKNSWNLPSKEAIDWVEGKRMACAKDLLVLTHDPTLTYLLEKRGYTTLSPYARLSRGENILAKRYQCIAVLKTFAGSIDDETIRKMYNVLGKIDYEAAEKSSLGYDANYKLKKMLDGRYPKYQIEINYYKGVRNLVELRSWGPKGDN